MATWLDGPEYAPLARPDEFAEPSVPPLEEPPPLPEPAAGPADRPRFSEPSGPVADLATLVPAPADPRDPQQAFDVVSSTLTTGGPWGGVHGALPVAPSEPAHQSQPVQPGPGWTAGHAPASGAPFPSVPGAHPPSGFPQPGTPQWFGPSPYGEQPSRSRTDLRALLTAATPGLLIVLVLAVLIKVLAPVLLVAAFFLARRVRVARLPVKRTFVIALGTIGTFALIGLVTGPLDFADWWSFVGTWSRLTALAVLVSVLLQVRRALLAGETAAAPPPEQPSYRGPWG